MPALRVYASDSYVVPVTANPRSGEVLWALDQKQHRDALAMQTVYDLDYDPVYPPLYNPIRECTGVLLQFDFGAVPALRGMKITALRGPFAYLSARETTLTASHGGMTTGYHTDNPFLIFTSDTPENPVGAAPLDAYCDLRFGRGELPWLSGDIHSSRLLLGCRASPVRAGRYAGRARLEFDSHAMARKPYLDVEYAPPAVEIVGAAPQAGFLDEHAATRLSWTLDSADRYTVGAVTQARATVQWRIQGTTSVSLIDIAGSDSFADIPAGTFPNEKIEWRVRAVSTSGIESEDSPWYQLTTIDVTPDPPDSLTPDSGVRDGSRPIQLGWRHNSPLGSAPTAFEIEADSGSGFAPLSGKVASGESVYHVPAGTLPSGTAAWRVRSYNTDDTPSDWSEPARFTVRAAPDAPVLRRIESGTPRPLVEWVAVGQRAAQLRVLDAQDAVVYDSGSLFGTQPQWRVADFLPDGRYRFEVRAQNEFGLWSEWGGAQGVVSSEKRLALTLTGQPVENGVTLTFHAEVAV